MSLLSEGPARRSLARRMRMLTALSTALFPAVAEAQLAENPSFGGGVFVGYTFGPRPGVEWGFEAFATHRFANESCLSEEPRAGIGPLLQFGLIGIRDPRLTLAVQGGSEISRFTFAMSGELGTTYRFGGNNPGFGLHTGISAEVLFFNTALRRQWFLDETWVGAGMRVQPTYGDQARCVVGRPLRTEARRVPVHTQVRHGSPSPAGVAEYHPEAGAAWAEDAQLECESVLAFLHLAEDLLAHGAPVAIIEATLDAACDEIRHAVLCAGLAFRFLGSGVRPSLPRLNPRPTLPGEAGLRRFAEESWLDGCIGEEAAARQARRGAERASDPCAAAAQRIIASDERRHAALAWKVLGWAVERGGAPVRDAVWELRKERPRLATPPHQARLEPYGVPSAEDCHQVSRQTASDSRRRLDLWMKMSGRAAVSAPRRGRPSSLPRVHVVR